MIGRSIFVVALIFVGLAVAEMRGPVPEPVSEAIAETVIYKQPRKAEVSPREVDKPVTKVVRLIPLWTPPAAPQKVAVIIPAPEPAPPLPAVPPEAKLDRVSSDQAYVNSICIKRKAHSWVTINGKRRYCSKG